MRRIDGAGPKKPGPGLPPAAQKTNHLQNLSPSANLSPSVWELFRALPADIGAAELVERVVETWSEAGTLVSRLAPERGDEFRSLVRDLLRHDPVIQKLVLQLFHMSRA